MTSPVYLGHSAAELETLYSHRHRIDDYDGYLERWPRDSARVRDRKPHRSDTAFGPHRLERYDAFGAAANAPVLVFFHGGYWHSQDKANFLFPAQAFVEAGVAFVGANYPLCPEVRIPDLIDSCRRCITHVLEHAGDFGGDPSRVYLAGHSAGAHIAATLLSTEPAAYVPASCSAVIRGALAISGVYDLTPICFLESNQKLHIPLAEVDSVSPIRNIPRGSGHLVLAVGDGEGEEFLRQQSAYAASMARRREQMRRIGSFRSQSLFYPR